MSKLMDVFYLVGNSDSNNPDDKVLRIESQKVMGLYEQFRNSLSEEQQVLFNELSEAENHVQGIQESIVAAKATALGIQIASEAFIINTGGDNYELYSK